MSNTGTFLAIAARSALATTFVVALWGKASGRAAFRSFAASLYELGLVGPSLRTPMAALVVVAEAGTVSLLAVPATARLGLLAAAVVMAAFTAGLSTSLIRGLRRPCHCFGASSTPLSWLHVVRNLILLATALVGAALPSSASGLVGVLAVPAGAVAAALLTRADDLVGLFQPASR